MAMKKFDQDLAALGARVMQMGTLAQQMVSMARLAMTELNTMYPRVMKAEDQLDKMQLEIDHEAVRLLIIYGPVAGDLRYVLSISHVNSALERIGDQAVGLCHSLETAHQAPDPALLPTLLAMGERAEVMVKDAMLAFFKRDAALARSIMSKDDNLDDLNDQVLNQTLSEDDKEGADKTNLASAVAQILMARVWERIGDQATNICEEVIYIVEGEDVRHARLAKPTRLSR